MTFGNHSSMVNDKDEDLGNKNILEKESKPESRASPNKNDSVKKPDVTPAKKPLNPLLGGTMNVGGIKLSTYGNSNRRTNPLLNTSNNKKTPAKPDPKESAGIKGSPEKTKEEVTQTSKNALARGNARAPVNRKR